MGGSGGGGEAGKGRATADWLGAGRGHMGELHREVLVLLLLFVSCCARSLFCCMR
jgi:hypothetical protein